MSLMKKAIGGSIHRIREFELEKVNLIEEFDILQIVGEGWFGKILLTEHRSTQTEMVLKLLPKAYTGISDFFREFHYGLHLAAHRNIITTYDVAFETAGFYVFSQEYAPLGDLTSNVTETGLGELHAKRVARQLAAAVHHIHSRELVHRDIKLDNVLVFRSDFSRIKLCDFGETRRVNTIVRRHNEWLPYSPPEVLQIDTDETYKALTSHDVWQFGIVLFVCLTGCLPWQKAALDDPRYTRYQNWHNATLNIAKKPKLFQLISSRAQRMFKRLLDPKAEKRPVSVLEVNKYLEDRWLAKLGAEKALNGGADERDELCPSMYSFHSSLEEKNQLLYTLTTYGIETTVDRAKKKDRIREWIQSSAIVEEMEEDESDFNEDVEDEDEEPHTMRGRHFPERRPSAATDNVRKKNSKNTKNGSSVPKRQPVKPTERKIPFAPQVAEERETVARYASFPNGDPNLALAKNDTNNTNGTLDSRRNNNDAKLSKLETSVESNLNSTRSNSLITSTNGRIENSSGNGASISRENSTSGYGSDQITNNNDSVPLEIPKSPQVPIRKHRAQTAPFPVPTSPRLESPRKSQSTAVLTKSRKENSPHPNVRGERMSPMNSQRQDEKSTRENQAVASNVNNNNNYPATLSNVEKSPTPPTTPQLTPANPVTMSTASQLVMQSFNALQNLNPSPCSIPSTPRNSTPPTTKTNQPEETYTYGKDAYEHYGIAQGVVFRMESTRRGSNSGSASRSVSN